ncbi:hypothetical protein [Phenylobacterium sp.]|jgi:hypothetical protein|uniref:hypothetical protein n=1 Tax=Phenylobacterium sp. TaxID=1871053 RepID=UPI002F95A8D2
MTWTLRLRQVHRWLSIVFVLAVIANLLALATKSQAAWIGFLALAPLIVLMLTGLWMFFAPYVGRRRGALVPAE